MTFLEIANELVAGCREGRERANLDRLYAEDAVSIEAADMGGGRETHGLAAIHAKHEAFDAMAEVHSGTTEGPFPHGEDRFAVIFEVDMTMKHTGKRSVMREVAVYHVAGGKIVREEFFYAT